MPTFDEILAEARKLKAENPPPVHHDFKLGEEVYYSDPDCADDSGYYTITEIDGDNVLIEDGNFSILTSYEFMSRE